MKVILTSLVVSLVLGGAAALALRSTWKPAHEVYSGTGVRLSEETYGENLVGPRWNGQSDGKYHPHTPHGS